MTGPTASKPGTGTVGVTKPTDGAESLKAY